MNLPLSRIAFVALFLAAPSLPAEVAFVATHDQSASDYQRWVEGQAADGYRIAFVSVAASTGTPRFTAVALKDAEPTGWLARSGLTGDEFQRLVTEQSKKGLRPVCVSGYLAGKTSRFAAVLVYEPNPTESKACQGRTASEFEKEVAAQKARGLRPDCISAHTDSAGTPRFAGIFVVSGKSPWIARLGLTEAEYQKLLDEYSPRGYRPVTTTAYLTADGPRFAIAFVKDNHGWSARNNLTGAEYQAECNRQAKKDFRPLSVVAYARGASGDVSAFDEAMQTFMKERTIPTGTITVSRNGAVLFSKGYGFADRAKKRPIKPEDPFRIASLSKPITAAAVRNLIAQGKLSLDTPAFAYLGLAPTGKKPDARLKDVTLRHLLEHKGGWDRDKTTDPMFDPINIAKALGKPGPASAKDVIRYMMGQPLQFAPGTKTAYSNFGYCVLGRVIEKATGQGYTAHIQKVLLAPMGIHSIELGRTLPALRNKREPFYADPGRGRSVLQPGSKALVANPDGTFYLEAMDSHGGLIASSVDLARFLEAYWITGNPRKDGGQHWEHLGSLPGTWTLMLQHPSGLNVAVVFNQRTDPSKKSYDAISKVMNDACKKVGTTEMLYAALWVKE